MSLPSEKILYSQDFQPDSSNIKNKCIADFYDVDSNIHEHILEVNEILKRMNNADNTNFASFMLEQTKINNEISTYCFKHFSKVEDLKITNNGLGLEIGIKAQLKPMPNKKLKF